MRTGSSGSVPVTRTTEVVQIVETVEAEGQAQVLYDYEGAVRPPPLLRCTVPGSELRTRAGRGRFGGAEWTDRQCHREGFGGL